MFGRKNADSDTVVRLLAAQVRRDISIGRLAPDAKLKIDELRQRYGGSTHSFREALTQLASEGLVEASAQRGFRVASATQTDLEDITRLRAEIETLGLDWSIKDRIARWSTAVTAQIGRMQDRDEMLEHAAQICELQHYIIGKMRERQAQPRLPAGMADQAGPRAGLVNQLAVKKG